MGRKLFRIFILNHYLNKLREYSSGGQWLGIALFKMWSEKIVEKFKVQGSELEQIGAGENKAKPRPKPKRSPTDNLSEIY